MTNTKHMMASLLFALFAAATVAQAEITPLIVTLTVDTTDYMVPSGKVFVIESVYSGNQYSNDQRIAIISATETNYMYVDHWFRKINQLQPPLKVPGQWTIRALLEGDDEHYFIFFGLLVDPEDLYAAIRSEFDYAAATLAEFESRLTLASPRPARVRMESRENTTDGEWSPIADLLSPTEGNRRQWDVADVIADIEKQYYRAAATSRATSGGIRKF